MRRILLILIPVLLILAILHTCVPRTIERVSDDSRVRLEIPEGALPTGTDVNSIHIVALDPATVATVPGTQPLFAYRLEPEGLVFAKPVKLIMDPGYWGPRQLPVLLHRSATALEALELEVTVVHEQVESVTASLSHFSEVLGTLSILSAYLADPGDQHMDAPFYVSSAVNVRPGEINKLKPPVRLSGGAFNARGELTPESLTDKPASKDMDPAQGSLEIEAFECTDVSTDNRISYTVNATFTLLLRDNALPQPLEVPINDRLTVHSTPFACLAAQPLPSVDRFAAERQPHDGTGDDVFITEVSKTPGGRISVGHDFTLKAEVRHSYEGFSTTAIDNWDLRYGIFEYSFITNDAISPLRVADVPWLAVIAPEDGWQGEARFRCMNAGSAVINYKAYVYAKSLRPNANGVFSFPVRGHASVECIADADALTPGSFTALTGTDRLGPIDSQVFNDSNGFQVRWWREPAADELYIGMPLKVHVEVENLRMPAGAPGDWTLSGELYTAAGNGLDPRRYPQAPPPGVPLPFRGVWSADYNFTCRNPDVAFLQHRFTLLPPGAPSNPPLQLSVADPGLKCIRD